MIANAQKTNPKYMVNQKISLLLLVILNSINKN